MEQWLLIALGAVLTLGTAVFVVAEFSFVALDRSSVQRAVDEGDVAAKPVLAALRRLSTHLSAAQLGITLTTLVLGYLATPSVGMLLIGPLRAVGVPEESVDAVGSTAALIIATLFSMVFGELVPQFLGISAPLRMAKLVARPMRLFSLVMKPLIAVLNGSANAILELLGVTPQEELSAARTPQELASIVRRSAQVGTLDQDTAVRVTRSLDFGSRTAVDVMTPRVRCVAVERLATAADVVGLARQTGHSRFPVTGGDVDDIDGLVHVKRAIAVPHQRRHEVPVSALMVEPAVVPETIRLDPLMKLLRGVGHQLAVVVDEYGGTSGIVTLEDVVEELVGEVADEHDRIRTTARRGPDGTWTVPAMWRPDEVRDRIGAPVPDGPDYESMGGFMMAALGRLAAVGDIVEVIGWRIRVEAVGDRRIERLRFLPIDPVTQNLDVAVLTHAPTGASVAPGERVVIPPPRFRHSGGGHAP
ncbi:MAG TPA: hemolysin family protein [Dermatophilaceae bacterium]|nr:hemolysin family protein [Dermatophilaceae bacterium]